MSLEKNTYGLSEGVFQACQFLGLKFPQQAIDKPQPTPADYFGDDIKLSPEVTRKLRSVHKWPADKFKNYYEGFSAKYFHQKPLKHTQTDLNVYFCDYVLFAIKQTGALIDNYFDYEFYNKSFELRNGFITGARRNRMISICNDRSSLYLTEHKVNTNRFFSSFLHRDWVDTRTCTFEDFKHFVKKHSRFFSKLPRAGQGRGAEILTLNPKKDLEDIFLKFKSERRLLEEVVRQHETLAAFCPDTLNTLRVNTLLDIHNNVHIMTTTGKFGRMGGVIDNVHRGGGYGVIVDPLTGIITSDGLNDVHERLSAHEDTGKVFKGFQYPVWEKFRSVVIEMARMLPHIRYIGWDITINDNNDIVLIETNAKLPSTTLQQAPDDTGRFYLYKPLVEEIAYYNREQMRLIGWRVNNFKRFNYDKDRQLPEDTQLQFALDKLIPDCTSLINLGCGKSNYVKSACPEGVEYFPVDFKAYTKGTIACNFNKGKFPDVTAETCLCALTAEYVEAFPQFLANMCAATRKQILMLCKPIDKETRHYERWKNPFLVDFTEEFLIKTLEQNNFSLNTQTALPNNKSMILYDFRKAPLDS